MNRHGSLPSAYDRPARTTSTMEKGVRMAVSAYILIQTEVGKAAQVATEVGGIDGVVSAEDVTGPYDVIARAEADSVDELGQDGGQPHPDDRRDHPNAHLPDRPPVVPPSRARPRPPGLPGSGSPPATLLTFRALERASGPVLSLEAEIGVRRRGQRAPTRRARMPRPMRNNPPSPYTR